VLLFVHSEQVKQAQAERQADFVLEDASEVGDIRRELLQKSNELALVTKRDEDLERTAGRLRAEKVDLDKDLLAMKEHRPGDLDPEIVQIKNDITQTEKEIGQRKSDFEQLTSEFENRQGRAAEAAEAHEAVATELAALQTLYAAEADKPQRQAKQTDHEFSHAIKSYTKQLEEATALHSRLTTDLNQHDEQRAVLAQTASELVVVTDQEHHKLGMLTRRGEQITLEFNQIKSIKSGALADTARYMELLKMTVKEVRRNDELIKRCARDKDIGLRQLRSVEIKVAHIKGQVEGEASQTDVLSSALKARKTELVDLKKAVEAAAADCIQINMKFASKQGAMTSSMIELKDKKSKGALLTIESTEGYKTVNELSRTIRTMQHEVDQAISRSMVAEANASRAKDELGNKDAVVLDSKKSLRTIEVALKELEMIYQVVKNEKNKYVTQISNSHQRQTEMKEKVRILANETEILRTSVLEKDAKVHLQAQLLNTKYRAREKELNEETQSKQKVTEIKAQMKSIKVDNQKQLDLVDVHKKKITNIKLRNEKAISDRDALGTQLLDRHDELIMYYEKLSIYSRMIRSGDLKIQEREEQIRFLRLEVQELQRGITLARGLQPEKERHMKELITNLEELKQTQEKVQILEKLIESPGHRKSRELEGPEPTEAELAVKANRLSERLVAKEEICLEKELILTETGRLTERAREQVEAGRTDTLTLARTVNDHQAKIKDVSRKLMANLSELSMYHGKCIQKEQELNIIRETTEEANARMANGDAPTEEIAAEWARIERRLEQDADEAEMQELGIAVDDENYGTRALAGGNRTFADLRPNAYIPNGPDDLPVPKPYGRDAPFKPSNPTPHFRHFRRSTKLAT
jgi:hypothetical protein